MGPVGADAGGVEVHEPQVVHDVPTADDEDSFPAKFVQLGTEIEVVVEGQFGVDLELQDRYVRGGEHVHEDRPRAVVDTPTVFIKSDVRGLDDINDALRE